MFKKKSGSAELNAKLNPVPVPRLGIQSKRAHDFEQERGKHALSRTSEPTVIRSGTTITGDITTAGEILVEGVLNGNVKADIVSAATGARIAGTVDATVVNVNGLIEGDVNCIRLQINTGGTVDGRIQQSVLLVEAGATLQGSVTMRNDSKELADANNHAFKGLRSVGSKQD